MKTQITLLRKDSSGLPGTVANAEHHAEAILPFIDAMRGPAAHLGFKLWRQGNNVHEFTSEDGRRFTLRAFVVPGSKCDYAGVRLAMRISRTQEEHLLDIDDVSEVPLMLSMMGLLARPKIGDDSRSLMSKAN